MSGSGLFANKVAAKAHLLAGHGVSSEVIDLRHDILAELKPVAAISVEEFTDLAATNTAGLLAATASTVAVQTQKVFLTGAAGSGALTAQPRSIKFTTAGSTASDAPANAVITGKDVNGKTQTETLALSQSAAAVETVKCYAELDSVVYAVGDGAGATIAIGIGTKVGLRKKLKARAGHNGFIQEIVNGQKTGTVVCDEFLAPVAAAAAGLLAATASTVAVQTVLTAGLISGGVTALAAFPRNVTFTTAGSTASDAPANVVVTGTDINGNPQTETVTLAQTATIAAGVKAFKTITSIVYAAGDGAGATVSIGFGAVFGLSRPLKLRAGATAVIQEIGNAVVVTTGTFVLPATSAPNGTYAMATAPDGAKNYAVYYESAAGSPTITSAAVSAPNGCYVPGLAPGNGSDYTVYYEFDATAV